MKIKYNTTYTYGKRVLPWVLITIFVVVFSILFLNGFFNRNRDLEIRQSQMEIDREANKREWCQGEGLESTQYEEQCR